ncbi:MAG: fatty acid desaturase, partial [Bacteroidota bacterium]
YFLSFLFRGVIDVTNYFRKRKLNQFFRRFLRGEFSFLLICFALYFVHWQAMVVVFVIPFVYIRFGMMAGNWGQHAFIDADDPANNYRNSINCINCTYNRQCFNDGYHIGHHLKPTLHWTELPQDFLKNRQEYAANGAIVFEGLDFFQVWFLLMTKRYDVLAKRFVDLSGDAPSQESIIELLKSRTRRISHSAQAA